MAETTKTLSASSGGRASSLEGKRVAKVLFSYYPNDARPRRAAEALVSAGMSVDLICLREKDDEPKNEVINGVHVRRVPIQHKRGGVLGYLFQYSAFLVVSAAIIIGRSLKHRYDLVYVNNMPDVLALCGLIPKIFGAKVILDLHDPMPELMMTIFDLPKESRKVRMLEIAEKWSIGIVDAVITVNRACARLFSTRSCRLEKITVIMNTPDEKLFRLQSPVPHTSAQNGKPFVIMYHGSVVERNGLDLLVEAFAKVHKVIPNAELRVFGSRNAYLDRVMETVRELGLQNSVHYLGSKPTLQIVEAIKVCDVGVIPNKRNIFTELNTPVRMFEYLSLGKPVIAPRAPGITDYFDDDSLHYFELGNAEDLAQRIVYVFDHPEESVKVTRRGQEIHRAHMWQEERLRLLGLAEELLCGRVVQFRSHSEEPHPEIGERASDHTQTVNIR